MVGSHRPLCLRRPTLVHLARFVRILCECLRALPYHLLRSSFLCVLRIWKRPARNSMSYPRRGALILDRLIA